MTDQPIAFTPEGRPLYDNTPTVVAVLVQAQINHSLIVVRRANHPGMGLLGLPGGYHMRGETWQQAGAREVAEETGHIVGKVVPYEPLITDEYGNNLQIALSYTLGFQKDTKLDGEAMEVLTISEPGDAKDWAFPLHYDAVRKFFAHVERQREKADA